MGSTADVSALLEKGADVQYIDTVKRVNAIIMDCDNIYYCFCPQNGVTALYMAAHKGKVDVVRLLTGAKAHVNIQTKVYTCTCTYNEAKVQVNIQDEVCCSS